MGIFWSSQVHINLSRRTLLHLVGYLIIHYRRKECFRYCTSYSSELVAYFIFCNNIVIREGADKSLARPTSRCRRTESIVSLERGVCSCAELQGFFFYKG